MNSAGTRLFPIALMAALAALTFWLDNAVQKDAGGRDGKRRHDPDYSVDNFLVRRFGADGELQHSLLAQRMLHYPDDDSTSVLAPRLTYHRTPPTISVADEAWLDKDGKHVRLAGNVRIVREGIGDRPPTQISTSVLYVEPDAEFAHTDAPVAIAQGRSVINGVGLEANNKTRVSVLFGPVRGTIYPQQAHQANSTHEPSQHEIKTPPHSARQPARRPVGMGGKSRPG